MHNIGGQKMGKIIGGIIVIWLIATLVYIVWDFSRLIAIWIIISAVICVYRSIKDRF